ncbi:MAG: hypothetical protein ABW023_13215 [Sphingomonas sp.]
MRVVKDAAPASGLRRGDSPGATRAAARNGVNAVNGTAGGTHTGPNAANAAAAAAAAKGSSMLYAGLFLLACMVGGVAFAIVRPF